MYSRKLIVGALSAAITLVSVVVIVKAVSRESDSDALARTQASRNVAPDLQYPKRDILGRDIPKFDYLIVMPDCKSCSDFRKVSRSFMEANPRLSYLILTPDLKDSSDLLKHPNYYVSNFTTDSKLANIPAGAYLNEPKRLFPN